MSGLVGRWSLAPTVGANLGDHQALGAVAVTHEHILAGAKLRDAEATQRLHMYEHIRGAFTGREEAEAANAIEPLHLEPLELACRLNCDVRAWGRHLRRMTCRRLIH